ncbi:MAG: hypothetical protein JNK14_01790 [Chitinophagaceae bacterium]|nr:hypothetical protein [Chitinophagaceae bacterium]
MEKQIRSFIIVATILVSTDGMAQDSSRIHFTTGVGVNKIKGSLSNTFRSTIAFNSALEVALGKNWFAQAELNFNTLKYDQQKKADNSSYLFRNTNSSLLLIGLNGGRDFSFANSWFISAYTGGGFVSVGEPRISVDEDNRVVTQTIAARTGFFGKGGTRVGYKTRSKIFQTLYIDGSYWTSTVKTQGNTLRGLSLFAGMRMSMK